MRGRATAPGRLLLAGAVASALGCAADRGKEMAFWKGLTLFRLGRRDEADRVLRRLARGEDDDTWVQRARTALAEIATGSENPTGIRPPGSGAKTGT